MNAAGEDLARHLEEGAAIDGPAGPARYEMIAQPDSLLVLDDVEDIAASFFLPAVQVVYGDIGDHVGKAAHPAAGAILRVL